MLIFTFYLGGLNQIALAAEAKTYNKYISEHSEAARDNDAIILQAVQCEHEKDTSVSDGFLLAGNNSTVTYKFRKSF